LDNKLFVAGQWFSIGINSTTISIGVVNVNDNVSLQAINNISVYTSNNYTLEINASDDDILIPDKRVFNESLRFASNTSWVSVQSTSFISGTSKMKATLLINPSIPGSGHHYVKINVSDSNGYSYDEGILEIDILVNNPPVWNSTSYTFYLNEGANTSMPINLTHYASDTDDGAI